ADATRDNDDRGVVAGVDDHAATRVGRDAGGDRCVGVHVEGDDRDGSGNPGDAAGPGERDGDDAFASGGCDDQVAGGDDGRASAKLGVRRHVDDSDRGAGPNTRDTARGDGSDHQQALVVASRDEDGAGAARSPGGDLGDPADERGGDRVDDVDAAADADTRRAGDGDADADTGDVVAAVRGDGDTA